MFDEIVESLKKDSQRTLEQVKTECMDFIKRINEEARVKSKEKQAII